MSSDALAELWTLLHSGQLPAARQLCLQLQDGPAGATAGWWHARGMLALADADAPGAVEALRRCIAIDPRDPAAHYHLGRALRAAGDDLAALDQYDRTLALAPAHWETHSSRGIVLRALGRLPEAIAAQRAAIALQPGVAELHFNLGNALFADHRPGEAVQAYLMALQRQPGHARAQRGLRVAQALQLVAERRWPEARALHEQLVTELPEVAALQVGLGISRWFAGDLEGARRALEQAHALDAGDGVACLHLGALLNERGLWPEALRWLDMAAERLPGSPLPLIESAVALQSAGDHAAALARLDAALTLSPGQPVATYHRASINLLLGHLQQGWRDFEARFEPGFVYPEGRPPFRMPPWRGEDLAERHLLVWAEQGAGDALQFARYLPAVASAAGQLSVRVHAPLTRLLQHSFPDLDLATEHAPLHAPAAFECPLMSLPLRLGLENVPLPLPVPYLRAPEALCAHWRAALPADGRRRIGLAWAGNPAHSRDAQRSIPLAYLAGLVRRFAAPERCEFHVLQKGTGLAALAQHADLGLIPSSDACADYADSAALMQSLDLILTVDTSVAHLAGALGRPTWILLPWLPDWRWGLGDTQCRWYPTARLFRQAREGDWDGVLEAVADALQIWLREGDAVPCAPRESRTALATTALPSHTP